MGRVTTVEKLDGNHFNQVIRVNILNIGHTEIMNHLIKWDDMNTVSFHHFPVKDAKHDILHEQTLDGAKLRRILQNNWPLVLAFK